MADPVHGRAAVADGASTSARPEVWARLLVEAFVGGNADPLSPPDLTSLRKRWHALVQDPGLAWYARAKLDEGAHATFLGLQVDQASLRYRAVAIGDSCLFHVRGRQLLAVGPLDRVGQFGRFPCLVSSRPDYPPAAVTVMDGEYIPGDLLLLATDALAKYLIAAVAQHQRIPSVTHLVRRPSHFAQTVHQLRRRGLLDNDDTTACLVRT